MAFTIKSIEATVTADGHLETAEPLRFGCPTKVICGITSKTYGDRNAVHVTHADFNSGFLPTQDSATAAVAQQRRLRH